MANPQKENGYTAIANEIVDKFCQYRISGEEWLVLWVILRKTYGFNKKEDNISLSQFAVMTGLKRPTVVRAINKLVSKKLLLIIQKATSFGNKYSFNKDFDTWKVVSKQLPRGIVLLSKKIMPVIQKDNGVLSKKIHTKDNYTKDTITKDLSKDKEANASNRGDPQINEVIEFLKAKLGGSLDGKVQENRRFAYLLLNRFKKDYPDKIPVNLMKALINFGIDDKFHGKNITNFKYLFYNAQKIIQSVKSRASKVLIL